jgi:hypothetical protein
MIQNGTDFDQFLPRRLAWGIVIAVLLAVALFTLPNLKFGVAEKKELDLADRNTFQQLLGMSKAELQSKFGPPTAVDKAVGTWSYQLPAPPRDMLPKPTYVGLDFDQADRCTKYWLFD